MISPAASPCYYHSFHMSNDNKLNNLLLLFSEVNVRICPGMVSEMMMDLAKNSHTAILFALVKSFVCPKILYMDKIRKNVCLQSTRRWTGMTPDGPSLSCRAAWLPEGRGSGRGVSPRPAPGFSLMGVGGGRLQKVQGRCCAACNATHEDCVIGVS